MKTPDWFDKSITEGIQRLMLLGLDRMPPSEFISGTVDAWCDALFPGRDWRITDADRIREGFRVLSMTRRTWPTPSEFLQAIPPRPEPKALPGRVWTDAEMRENRRRLREMIEAAFPDLPEEEDAQ